MHRKLKFLLKIELDGRVFEVGDGVELFSRQMRQDLLKKRLKASFQIAWLTLIELIYERSNEILLIKG